MAPIVIIIVSLRVVRVRVIIRQSQLGLSLFPHYTTVHITLSLFCRYAVVTPAVPKSLRYPITPGLVVEEGQRVKHDGQRTDSR